MHIATTHVALEKNLIKSILPQGTADTRTRSSEFSIDAKLMGPSNYQIGLFLRQVAVRPASRRFDYPTGLRWPAQAQVDEMPTIRPSGKPLTGNQWALRFRGLIVANHPNDALNWLVTAI